MLACFVLLMDFLASVGCLDIARLPLGLGPFLLVQNKSHVSCVAHYISTSLPNHVQAASRLHLAATPGLANQARTKPANGASFARPKQAHKPRWLRLARLQPCSFQPSTWAAARLPDRSDRPPHVSYCRHHRIPLIAATRRDCLVTLLIRFLRSR